MMNFEQYVEAEQTYFNFLESIANIRADVEECRENPPVILNKEYDSIDIKQIPDRARLGDGEEV
jgi:hypothetical protein